MDSELKNKLEEQAERLAQVSPFKFLVNAVFEIERLRIAALIRQSHLALKGRSDAETDNLLKKLQEVEEYADGRMAALLKEHPAYNWFSRIQGVGDENVAKIVGMIDIEKAHTISSLWSFAGYGVKDGKAPKREKGEKLPYNSQLRTMCWRTGSSIMKGGIRQFCTKCNEKRPPKKDGEEPKCVCGSVDFVSRATSKYADFYLKQKKAYAERFAREGREIVPATQLPKVAGKRVENEKFISEGHVHNMALRKMMKLFLSHLWLVWREAEGLPTREPYIMEHGGHTTFIAPWAMVDKPAKKPRKKVA